MPGQIVIYALLILLLPLATFGILYFYGNKLPRKGDWLATGFMGICVLLSVIVLAGVWNSEPVRAYLTWFTLPGARIYQDFTISVLITSQTAMMLVLVTFISFLVHLYSIEYMYDKKNYTRYFPYLGLFTSSMVGIVLSDNLLVTFMCWELVGFASYLLIGFWMEKQAAAKAAKKAFLINRIGDAGFLIGLCIVYVVYGTLDLSLINVDKSSAALYSESMLTLAGLGIFLGCVGKSAQFPLQLWLPDAMEGPTPASALIHAATMVAAGIYLLAKTYLLLTPDALVVIAFTGAITTLTGAFPALAQTDIKKVLAFSTISQLGFMVLAIGVQAYDAALFHLITHAFFKACLFLAAGAVIHEMHYVKRAMFIRGYFHNFDTLNMKLMGGLREKMPVTFITYFISCMALIGVPLFSGFLSKDAILEGAFNWAAYKYQSTGSSLFYLVPLAALMAVFCTAYYMMRQMILVFFGDFKLIRKYPQAEPAFAKLHDPGWLMKIPMILLSILSISFFYSVNPFNGHGSWITEQLGSITIFDQGTTWSFKKISVISIPQSLPLMTVPLLSVLIVTAGIGFAVIRFRPSVYDVSELPPDSYRDYSFRSLLKSNWYMDKIYHHLLVRPGVWVSRHTASADIKLIDGFIHVFSVFNVVFAHLIAFADRYIIDGFVSLSAKIVMGIGGFSRKFQQGNIQSYLLYSVLALVLVFVWLYMK